MVNTPPLGFRSVVATMDGGRSPRRMRHPLLLSSTTGQPSPTAPEHGLPCTLLFLSRGTGMLLSSGSRLRRTLVALLLVLMHGLQATLGTWQYFGTDGERELSSGALGRALLVASCVLQSLYSLVPGLLGQQLFSKRHCIH